MIGCCGLVEHLASPHVGATRTFADEDVVDADVGFRRGERHLRGVIKYLKIVAETGYRFIMRLCIEVAGDEERFRAPCCLALYDINRCEARCLVAVYVARSRAARG